VALELQIGEVPVKDSPQNQAKISGKGGDIPKIP
jgi:hypothetical protein